VRSGALASNEANADPIDLAFLHAASARKLLDGSAKTVSFQPFSAATRRTEAIVEIAGSTSPVIIVNRDERSIETPPEFG
jgi:H+-transporting ATPase